MLGVRHKVLKNLLTEDSFSKYLGHFSLCEVFAQLQSMIQDDLGQSLTGNVSSRLGKQGGANLPWSKPSSADFFTSLCLSFLSCKMRVK